MKNARLWVMVLLSMVSGVLAIGFAARWLNEQGSLATTKVAVAAIDLGLGAQLTGEQIKLVDWPRTSVPAGSFSDPGALKNRVARIGMARDEPILEHKLAEVGARGGLSAVITKGKRAITVRVNDVVGVAGFALPGNYVDVILSTRDERKAKEDQTVAKIVLENILVLAAGEEAGRDDPRPKAVKAVTLEVTPEEAEAIDLARSVGQLSLVLRNQVDSGLVRTAGITKEGLLGGATQVQSKPAARVVRAAAECVELFNGRQHSKQCF